MYFLLLLRFLFFLFNSVTINKSRIIIFLFLVLVKTYILKFHRQRVVQLLKLFSKVISFLILIFGNISFIFKYPSAHLLIFHF